MSNKRIIALSEKVTPDSGDFFAIDNPSGGTKKYQVKKILDQIAENAEDITDLKGDLNEIVTSPELRNGSMGNSANANAVAMVNSLPTYGARGVWIETTVSLTSGYFFRWILRIFASGGTATSGTNLAEYDPVKDTTSNKFYLKFPEPSISGGFGLALFETNGSAFVPLRIANVGEAFKITYDFEPEPEQTFGDTVFNKIYQNKEITAYDVYDDFWHGGLTGTGTIYLSQKFRVSNQLMHYAEDTIRITVKSGFRFGWCSFSDASGTSPTWHGWYTLPTTISKGTYFRFQIARTSENQSEIADVATFAGALNISTSTTLNTEALERQSSDIVPVLVDGSALNRANAYSVSPQVVLPTPTGAKTMQAIYTGDLPENAYITWGIYGFTEAAEGLDPIQANSLGYTVLNTQATMPANQRNINLLDYLPATAKCYSVNPWVYNSDVTAVALRVASDQYCIRVHTSYFAENVKAENAEIAAKLSNARHIKGGSGTPLTLLHFSDLHADSNAMNRIINDADGLSYDDAICTGDMTANTYGQISSWWNPVIMTCIGNHDCASYDSTTGYNWTALSMANRDAYYIAPFESNWGITHTSGTSYYYKDYTAAKVRLIVMDAMLYTNAGSEATAQTSWLNDLLSSAITNNLHVLIAIHAPHGGATAEDCSFSKYGGGTMPTNGDCNTPQTVIDAVAAKITAGLKFIGYLVGHTHQDNVWDAEGNGKQLMYCITCAAVSQTAQWQNADMYRGVDADAFNIVTIDTSNTLVKIVRCGGADIDDHMRTRKAICFNYSTGEKVGEVL